MGSENNFNGIYFHFSPSFLSQNLEMEMACLLGIQNEIQAVCINNDGRNWRGSIGRDSLHFLTKTKFRIHKISYLNDCGIHLRGCRFQSCIVRIWLRFKCKHLNWFSAQARSSSNKLRLSEPIVPEKEENQGVYKEKTR